MASRYLVECQFFNVSFSRETSIKEIFDFCNRRSLETLPDALAGDDTGPGLTTTIRFFDRKNILTDLIIEYRKLNEKKDKFLEGVESAWYIARFFQLRRYQRTVRIIKLHRKMIQSVVAELIKEERENHGWEVAIQAPLKFRRARSDEYPAIYHSAVNAHGLWVFVMKPNDLLSNSNQHVACLFE